MTTFGAARCSDHYRIPLPRRCSGSSRRRNPRGGTAAVQLKGPITSLGTLLGSSPGAAPRGGGEVRGGKGELRGGWPAGRVCAARDAAFWGERQKGNRRVGDQNTSRSREGWGRGGSGRVTPVQASQGMSERGRRRWVPKKEVRNCGGGSRPWKGWGKGEARMEGLHFRGEGPESLPGPGLPEPALGEGRRVPEVPGVRRRRPT